MGGTPSAVLNECLEEAVALCVRMTHEARGAEELARHVEERARAIERAVSEQAAGRHEAFARACAEADRATQEVEAPAAPALEDLAATAGDADEAVGLLLATVRAQATTLGALRDRAAERLDLERQRAEAGRQALAGAAGAHGDGLETARAHAADGLLDLRAERDIALQDLGDARRDLETAFDAVAREGLHGSGTISAGVAEALHRLGDQAARFANDAIRRHNRAAGALRATWSGDPDPASPGLAEEWAAPSFATVLPAAARAAEALDEARVRADGLASSAAAEGARSRDALDRILAATIERAAAVVPGHLP